MARVYLDTSYVSSLVTTRQDAASLYRRSVASEWQSSQSHHHELFVSSEVLLEIQNPSFASQTAALDSIQNVPLLEVSERVLGVASVFVSERLMPAPEGAGDAIHVAVAAVHNVEFLLSWNVRHLANPNKVRHLQVLCQRLGLLPPTIITPEALWKDLS